MTSLECDLDGGRGFDMAVQRRRLFQDHADRAAGGEGIAVGRIEFSAHRDDRLAGTLQLGVSVGGLPQTAGGAGLE